MHNKLKYTIIKTKTLHSLTIFHQLDESVQQSLFDHLLHPLLAALGHQQDLQYGLHAVLQLALGTRLVHDLGGETG